MNTSDNNSCPVFQTFSRLNGGSVTWSGGRGECRAPLSSWWISRSVQSRFGESILLQRCSYFIFTVPRQINVGSGVSLTVRKVRSALTLTLPPSRGPARALSFLPPFIHVHLQTQQMLTHAVLSSYFVIKVDVCSIRPMRGFKALVRSVWRTRRIKEF